jgi:hypothetical protein
MSAFTLKLIQVGFLVLLWLMVLSVAAVMRSDMFARRRNRPTKQPKPPKPPKPPKAPKRAPKQTTAVASAGAAATQPSAPAGALFGAGSGSSSGGAGDAGAAAVAGVGAATAAAGSLAGQAPTGAGARVAGEGVAAGGGAAGGRSAKQAKPKRGAPRNLVIVSGVGQGTAVELGATPISIGRSPGNTLVLEDDYVSGRHARLYPHEGAWVVEDLGSTNGTYLDRARLTAPVVLPVGTPVRIGKSVLELRK